MKKTIIITMLVALLPVLSLGCDDGSSSGGLYSISDNLVDPVSIVLTEEGTKGTITLELSEALPEHSEGDDGMVSLISDAITLDIENQDGIAYGLSEGDYVTAEPQRAGEWTIMLGNSDRTQINIVFYNEIEGRKMTDEDTFSAFITVSTNDYFVEEYITREATVTE